MMYDSVVSDIKNELNDWLNVRGGDVTDMALSLINQAIEQLWNRRPWDVLLKTATLSLTNNIAPLPADFGRLVYIGSDLDGDGVVDWYYSNGDRNTKKRYDFESTLSSTNQITLSVKFNDTPQQTPKICYVVKLNKVVNDTDYLFFPASLVLVTAQKIHEKDNDGIATQWKELIVDFEESNYHIDRSMQKIQQDVNFNALYIENYDLEGTTSDYIPSRPNSEDR